MIDGAMRPDRTIAPPEQRLLIFHELRGEEASLPSYASPSIYAELLWAPGPHITGPLLRQSVRDQAAAAMQTGATLSDRLAMAFSERFFFHRALRIVAVNFGGGAVSHQLIDDAFDQLRQNDWVSAHDAARCVLIGCHTRSFRTFAFTRLSWPRVTASDLRTELRGQTLSQLRA